MFYVRYPDMDNLYTREYNSTHQISYFVDDPSFFGGTLAYDIPPLSSLPVSTNPTVRFMAGNQLRAPT